MNTITVKVAKVPGAVSEVVLNEGATVKEAIELAGISLASNETVKVGTNDADLNTPVNDGDYVVVSAGAKSA